LSQSKSKLLLHYLEIDFQDLLNKQDALAPIMKQCRETVLYRLSSWMGLSL